MTATAPRFSYRICSYVILPSLDGPRRRRAPRRERESLLQPLDFMGIHLVDILLRRFRQLDRRIAGREEDDGVAGRHDRAVLVLDPDRSEEHTSELQSLLRSSYAGFCFNKK